MQGTPRIPEPQQQTTWRVLVIGLVLDDLGVSPRLPNLGLADIALNGGAKRMPTELKLPTCQLGANFS